MSLLIIGGLALFFIIIILIIKKPKDYVDEVENHPLMQDHLRRIKDGPKNRPDEN